MHNKRVLCKAPLQYACFPPAFCTWPARGHVIKKLEYRICFFFLLWGGSKGVGKTKVKVLCGAIIYINVTQAGLSFRFVKRNHCSRIFMWGYLWENLQDVRCGAGNAVTNVQQKLQHRSLDNRTSYHWIDLSHFISAVQLSSDIFTGSE